MPPWLVLGQDTFSSYPARPGVVFEDAHHFHIVFGPVAEDVGENRGAEPGQRGQLFADEGADADVLQADGIDHAARGFVDPRRRVAFDRLARKPFHHQAAERVEVHQLLEFEAVAKRARGRQDGVAQRDAAQGRRQGGCNRHD